MVFFGLTGMIPPERTMFKAPQVGRDTGSGQQLSSMEKLIRYAEKDDWLLYVTALFGILMPGIMYFFYRKAHNAYEEYAKTRALVTQFKKLLSDIGGHEIFDSVFCYNDQVPEHFDVWMTEAKYTTKRLGVGKQTTARRRPAPETSESETEASYISSEDDTDHEKFE
ncbi:hypothetical protein FO519_005611 [Halicephalobus sp. NKZ332]|nr:hypothetical protein FO519_005611 [Halicephalobus sp. NKZ332]